MEEMSISKEFRKRFLTDTDSSGRFIVKSIKTGRTYYVEPIDDGNRSEWGDLNPATKKIEGDYGSRYKGSVKRSESLISTENGFDKVTELKPGESPTDYISRIDEEFYEAMKNRK